MREGRRGRGMNEENGKGREGRGLRGREAVRRSEKKSKERVRVSVGSFHLQYDDFLLSGSHQVVIAIVLFL